MDLQHHGMEVRIIRRRVGEARPNRRHSHPHFELLLISEGHTRVQIRGRTLLAGPGDLLIYHPGIEHRETVQPGRFDIVVIRFAPQRPEISGRFPGVEDLGPLLRLPWRERFQNLFQAMIAECAAPDAWSGQLLSSYLTQFVCLLQRARTHGRPNSDTDGDGRIRLALDLMHEQLNAELPLGALAARAELSESRFSHCFKEMLGVSPKQYLIRARLDRACGLLTSSTLPVARIAALVGYREPGRFHKAFRQAFGCAPGTWRRQQEVPAA